MSAVLILKGLSVKMTAQGRVSMQTNLKKRGILEHIEQVANA